MLGLAWLHPSLMAVSVFSFLGVLLLLKIPNDLFNNSVDNVDKFHWEIFESQIDHKNFTTHGVSTEYQKIL